MRRAVTPRALLAGAMMFGAYVLALGALELAEAAPVAALRETSVVMAVVGAAVVGAHAGAGGADRGRVRRRGRAWPRSRWGDAGERQRLWVGR